MSNILIRGVSPGTVSRLKQRARAARMSMNRYVRSRIEKLASGPDVPTEHHDLDSLFGSMTAEDATAIAKTSARARRIDRDLWR